MSSLVGLSEKDRFEAEANVIIDKVVKSSNKILTWLESDIETGEISEAKFLNMMPFKTQQQPSCFGPMRRKRLQTVRERNAIRNSRLPNNGTANERKFSSRYSSTSEEDSMIDASCLNITDQKGPKSMSSQRYVDYFKESNDCNNYRVRRPRNQRTAEPMEEISDMRQNSQNDSSQRSSSSIDTTLLDDEEDEGVVAEAKQCNDNSTLSTPTTAGLTTEEMSSPPRSNNQYSRSSTETEEYFYCPACLGRKFCHFDSLERHLKQYHKLNLKPQDLMKLKTISSTKSSMISLQQAEGNSKKVLYSRPFNLSSRPKPKLGRASMLMSPPNGKSKTEENIQEREDEATTVIAKSNARSANGDLICLKCDYSFTAEDEFYEHVKSTHVWSDEEVRNLKENGAEPSEFYCPECASVFVTKSALCMHLKGNHEFLIDVQMYLEKIGYGGEIPLLENQCDICYSLFQQPWELEKHFRTHGMAFLRRQKLFKLLRSNNLI